MIKHKVVTVLARKIQASLSAEQNESTEWNERHWDAALAVIDDYLPHGSGVDSGVDLEKDRNMKPDEKLVLSTSFHHMDEYGGYDKWTDHDIVITPSLSYGFNLRVTGRDHRDIKEYLGSLFHDCLNQKIEKYPLTKLKHGDKAG